MQGDPVVITVMLGLVIALVEFIKYLIEKFKHKSSNGLNSSGSGVFSRCGFNDNDRKMLVKLYDTHNILDRDGLPMWYFPRSWGETQEKISESQRQFSEMQRDFMSLMQQLIRTMERIDDKLGNKKR